MTDNASNRIIQGLQEAVAHARGEVAAKAHRVRREGTRDIRSEGGVD